MIGDDIQVTVIDVRGDKVRLGFTAPKHIGVHRKEVFDAIQRENRQAASLAHPDVLAAGMRATGLGGIPAPLPTLAETIKANEAALKR